MKRLQRLALRLLAGGLCLAVTACTGPEAPASSESPASSETPVSSETPASSETPVNSETPVSSETPASSEAPASSETSVGTADAPVPDFLTAEQQALYRKAKVAYPCFRMETWLINTIGVPGRKFPEGERLQFEKDGRPFYQAIGPIRTWEQFEEYMLAVFTPEYLDELIGDPPRFIDADGALYFTDGTRGSNDRRTWESETYELVSRTEDQIQFEVVGYYYTLDTLIELEIAFEKELPKAKEMEEDAWWAYRDAWWAQHKGDETKSYPITLVRTADGWRFSEFNITY